MERLSTLIHKSFSYEGKRSTKNCLSYIIMVGGNRGGGKELFPKKKKPLDGWPG